MLDFVQYSLISSTNWKSFERADISATCVPFGYKADSGFGCSTNYSYYLSQNSSPISVSINHAARNALNKPIRELISLRTLLKYSLSFASFMANQKLDNKRQECRLSNRKLFSTFYTEHSSIFSYLKINDFIGR